MSPASNRSELKQASDVNECLASEAGVGEPSILRPFDGGGDNSNLSHDRTPISHQCHFGGRGAEAATDWTGILDDDRV
jgi:hypothetical protein